MSEPMAELLELADAVAAFQFDPVNRKEGYEAALAGLVALKRRARRAAAHARNASNA